MTLPNTSIFNFTEIIGSYTDFNSLNLNVGVNQLLANDNAIKTAVDAIEAKFSGTKAKDSELLDGIDSLHFQREQTYQFQIGKWGRISKLYPSLAGSYGGSVLVNFSHTHGNTVWNTSVSINFGHSTWGQIVVLNSGGYTPIRLRLVSVPNTNGSHVYLEQYGTGYMNITDYTGNIGAIVAYEAINCNIIPYTTFTPEEAIVDANGIPVLDVSGNTQSLYPVLSDVTTQYRQLHVGTTANKILHSGNTVVDADGFIKIV